MALVKEDLKSKLEKRIKDLEDKLYKSLNDKNKGIYNVQKQLDIILSKNIPTKNFNAEKYKQKLWESVSKEWSKALAKQILDTLSKELSIIISDEMTDYIKSATIITPPGQAVQVAPPTGTGATSANSPKANIS